MALSTHESSVSLDENISVQTLFELMNNAVREKDLDKIKALMPYAGLLILNAEHHSVVYELAFEGSRESLDILQFLRLHFPAMRFPFLKEMIRAFASAGHTAELKAAMEEAINPSERFIFLKMKASGLCFAGRIMDAKKILGEARNEMEWQAIIQFMIRTLAEKGEEKEVNDLLPLAPDSFKQCLWEEKACMSYAATNHLDMAYRLLDSKKKPFERSILRDAIISGCALAGNEEEVNKIIDQENDREKKFSLIRTALENYAERGLVTPASNLFAFATNPMEQRRLIFSMLGGYARCGHVGLVNKAASQIKDTVERLQIKAIIVFVYAAHNHVDLLNNMLALPLNEVESLLCLSFKALGLACAGNVMQAAGILETASANQKILIATELMSGYIKADLIEEATKLLGLAANSEDRWNMLDSLVSSCAGRGDIFTILNIKALTVSDAEWYGLLSVAISKFAEQGRVEEVNSLFDLTQSAAAAPFRLSMRRAAAQGYASGGYMSEAYDVLANNKSDREAILRYIMLGCMRSERVESANDLLTKISEKEGSKLTVIIANHLKKRDLSTNKDTALMTLAQFKPFYQKKIVNNLNLSRDEAKRLNIKGLVSKAEHLHPYLTEDSPLTKPVNFRYRLGNEGKGCWLTVQELFIRTGLSLIKEKNIQEGVLFIVATFIAHLTSAEAKTLSDNMRLRYRPSLFHKKTSVQEDKTPSVVPTTQVAKKTMGH